MQCSYVREFAAPPSSLETSHDRFSEAAESSPVFEQEAQVPQTPRRKAREEEEEGSRAASSDPVREKTRIEEIGEEEKQEGETEKVSPGLALSPGSLALQQSRCRPHIEV